MNTRGNPPADIVRAVIVDAAPWRVLTYEKGGVRVKVRAPTVACLRAWLESFEGYSLLGRSFMWELH